MRREGVVYIALRKPEFRKLWEIFYSIVKNDYYDYYDRSNKRIGFFHKTNRRLSYALYCKVLLKQILNAAFRHFFARHFPTRPCEEIPPPRRFVGEKWRIRRVRGVLNLSRRSDRRCRLLRCVGQTYSGIEPIASWQRTGCVEGLDDDGSI